jgi:recombination protein RecR
MPLPEPIQRLVTSLERLPGIGPKTASRLAFYLLRAPEDISQDLSGALDGLKDRVAYCEVCFNITEAGRTRCEICDDPGRDASLLCVVADALNVLALERTGGYRGEYHVLQGLLSPIDGITPEDLRIAPLLQRLSSGVKEVIIATNPSMEGDATAMYLGPRLLAAGVRVTRLGLGLPVGGDLDYADQNTLLRSLAGRQDMT